MPLPLTLNNLNTDFLTFMVRVVISLGIGMMIGLEREWAQKDLGARTFSIVALAFTLGWGISREVAYILLLSLIHI